MAGIKKPDVRIRVAIQRDYREIVRLNEENLHAPGSQGFMLTPLTEASIDDAVSERGHRFFVAEDAASGVISFLEVSPDADKDVLAKVAWASDDARELFCSRKRVYLEKAVTDFAWRRRGVAWSFYEALAPEWGDALLYSFVVARPIRNDASFRVHFHLGFRELARFEADEYGGLRDYESVLLAR